MISDSSLTDTNNLYSAPTLSTSNVSLIPLGKKRPITPTAVHEPIVPLSETQLDECLSEELGEGVYSQRIPSLISDKSLTHTNNPYSAPTPSTSTAILIPLGKKRLITPAAAHEPTYEDDNSQKIKKPKRNRNPEAVLEKQRLKHPLLPPCSCKKQCLQNIPEIERQSIHTQFWNLDRQRRRDFLSRSVNRLPTTCTKTKGESRRHNTLVWSLNDIKVCKVFFLRTLGFTNDEAVQSVLKNNYFRGNKNPKVSATPDLRGRQFEPANKFPQEYEDRLKEFILKYNPISSHYNSNHAPNRKYLPVGINFSTIFKHYKQFCQDNNLSTCGWTHFHNMVKKLNLSTAELSQDICTKCKNHKIAHEKLPLPCNCQDCIIIGQHLENKRNSRRDLKLAEERSDNSEGKEAVFTVDMQKAICMPLLTTKEYYFSRKLILFNESFVPPGKNKNAACILWHEGESGRKAHNIATTYIYFIRKYCRDLHNLNFFLDNCNAQNKNKILFSALVRVVNDDKTSIQSLKLEYFEPGHTFMAADAVHAAITKKLKSAREIYDLEDFVTNIKQSRKNLDVDVLKHNDMLIFKNDSKTAFPKDWNIQNLKVVEFRRGKLSLFAKNDYNGELKEIHFLKKKVEGDLRKMIDNREDLINMIETENKPRGISEVKKKELLILSKSMPASRRRFYEALEESDAPDLDTNIDSDL